MILFKSLSRASIHLIIDLELKSLYNRIEELGYTIQMTDEAKDFIVDKGYDEKFGARPLKRAIQKYVEDPLAEQIINATIKEGDTIVLSLNEDKDGLDTSVEKPKKSKKEN